MDAAEDCGWNGTVRYSLDYEPFETMVRISHIPYDTADIPAITKTAFRILKTVREGFKSSRMPRKPINECVTTTARKQISIMGMTGLR